MHGELGAAFPGRLDDLRGRHRLHLGGNVELAETVPARVVGRLRVELLAMRAGEVAQRLQPQSDRTGLMALERGAHAAAAVVAGRR